jgi:hypothetical protein
MRYRGRARHVDEPPCALDPQPRLVHVDDLCLLEPLLDLDFGQERARGTLGHHPPYRARRDGAREEVRQQLTGAPVGQQLVVDR